MQKVTAILGFVVLVVACAGCEAPSVDELGVAPMLVEPRPWAIDRPAQPPRPSPRVAPDAPHVLIEARFLSGTVADLRKAGVATEKDCVILPQTKAEELLQRQPPAAKALRVLSAPKVIVLSGQEAFVTVGTEWQCVTDWQYVPGTQPARGGQGSAASQSRSARPLRPVQSSLSTGINLTVCAAAEKDQVVFTKVQPRQTQLLDSRPYWAVVRIGGKDLLRRWHEPVVLVAQSRLNTPCRIGVKPGQLLVVPLAYRLAHCPPATVRLLAKGGVVETRTGERSAALQERQLAPANSQLVVLLSARQVQPAEAKRPAPAKSAAAPPTKGK